MSLGIRNEAQRMMAIGNLWEFQPQNETVAAYLKRMELSAANEISDEKSVTAFLSMIGRPIYYTLLCNLAPAKLVDQPLETVTEALRVHFEPKKIVIAE